MRLSVLPTAEAVAETAAAVVSDVVAAYVRCGVGCVGCCADALVATNVQSASPAKIVAARIVTFSSVGGSMPQGLALVRQSDFLAKR